MSFISEFSLSFILDFFSSLAKREMLLTTHKALVDCREDSMKVTIRDWKRANARNEQLIKVRPQYRVCIARPCRPDTILSLKIYFLLSTSDQ